MKTAAITLALAASAFGQSLTSVLSGNPQLSMLNSLVMPYAQGLSNMTNITLLAPNNAAVSALMNSSAGMALASQSDMVQAILNYHVLQGNHSNFTNTSFVPSMLMPGMYANVTGGQRVEAVASGSNVTFFSGLLQNSSVTNASIKFDGGVIHVINRFLTVPQNCSSTAVALNLTSAVGAIQTLNLTSTVDNTPNLTVFVPNNAAFQRIGSALANASVADLTSILSYHVVPGVYYSTNITNGSMASTYSMMGAGPNVTFRLEGSNVFVNGAKVIRPNVLVANGVIHVIDRVLNPMNATQIPNTSATVDGFAGASSVSMAPFTSGVPTPTSAIDTAAAGGAMSSAAGSSSSKGGAARPMETGAVALAALFGGAAAALNM